MTLKVPELLTAEWFVEQGFLDPQVRTILTLVLLRVAKLEREVASLKEAWADLDERTPSHMEAK